MRKSKTTRKQRKNEAKSKVPQKSIDTFLTPIGFANILYRKIEERQKRIDNLQREVDHLQKRSLEDARQIGQILEHALKDVPHGEKRDSVFTNFEGSVETATHYRRIAKHWMLVMWCGSINDALRKISEKRQQLKKPKKAPASGVPDAIQKLRSSRDAQASRRHGGC
jgi:hypothetical protein